MATKNIIQSIGRTPLLKLKRFSTEKKVNIFVKMEGQNPGGSIKDRVALYMIRTARQRRELKKGQTILEATSGNMGISLAMLGAYFGYPVEIVMPVEFFEFVDGQDQVMGGLIAVIGIFCH